MSKPVMNVSRKECAKNPSFNWFGSRGEERRIDQDSLPEMLKGFIVTAYAKWVYDRMSHEIQSKRTLLGSQW